MATRIDRYGRIIREPSSTQRPSPPPHPTRQTEPPPARSAGRAVAVSNRSSFPFYVITLVLCAAASWFLAGFVSVLVFNADNARGWLPGVSTFFHNVGPYMTFLGAIAGCFWYNKTYALLYDFEEVLLSLLSAVVASLIFGAFAFVFAAFFNIGIIVAGIFVMLNIGSLIEKS